METNLGIVGKWEHGAGLKLQQEINPLIQNDIFVFFWGHVVEQERQLIPSPRGFHREEKGREPT